MTLNELQQIAIIGPGLLGASIGLALKERGFAGRIVGASRRRETAETAKSLGCIDDVATDIASAASESDLVIVAVPLGAFEGVFEQIAGAKNHSAVITDVGSTKLTVTEMATKYLPEPQRFVGAHPMAGSEAQGPAAARAELFRGKPCIITPLADTDPTAVSLVHELWQTLGMSILTRTPAQHDDQAAVISHLPHAVAAMLIQTAIKEGGWDLASTGFRDTTRLASSNPPMRADIMLANRASIVRMLSQFSSEIDKMMKLLAVDDREAITRYLTDAKTRRDEWLGEKSI